MKDIASCFTNAFKKPKEHYFQNKDQITFVRTKYLHLWSPLYNLMTGVFNFRVSSAGLNGFPSAWFGFSEVGRVKYRVNCCPFSPWTSSLLSSFSLLQDIKDKIYKRVFFGWGVQFSHVKRRKSSLGYKNSWEPGTKQKITTLLRGTCDGF